MNVEEEAKALANGVSDLINEINRESNKRVRQELIQRVNLSRTGSLLVFTQNPFTR